jgi:hypothetical protein
LNIGSYVSRMSNLGEDSSEEIFLSNTGTEGGLKANN